MGDSKMRYLLFADVLGTGSLYAAGENKAHIIERKRTVLEHCARISIFPYLSYKYGSSNHLSLFSDTVLFACEEISALFEAAANLYYTFSQHSFPANSMDDLYLLRGGIAYGRALTSDALSSSQKVSVAKIFDTSLALSYRLEGIRRGSRIFLCEETYKSALASGSRACFKWTAISGIGPPIAPAFEYNWPAFLLSTPGSRFCPYLNELARVWLSLFSQREIWKVAEYDQTLYQLDETIKVCIRASMLASEEVAIDVFSSLLGLLPSFTPELEEIDIRFTWGTWFQVFWAILVLTDKYPSIFKGHDTTEILRENIFIITRKGYTKTFRAELQQEDYLYLRQRLFELDVFKY
jgi:hypothetical protein